MSSVILNAISTEYISKCIKSTPFDCVAQQSAFLISPKIHSGRNFLGLKNKLTKEEEKNSHFEFFAPYIRAGKNIEIETKEHAKRKGNNNQQKKKK